MNMTEEKEQIELKLKKLGIQYDHWEWIQNPDECPVMDDIENKKKKVEGRVNKKGKSGIRRSDYKRGEILIFVDRDSNSILICVVVETRIYETLEEYVSVEGYQNVIPVAKNQEEALTWYRTGTSDPNAGTANSWASEELVDKYGMVAIEIKPILKLFI